MCVIKTKNIEKDYYNRIINSFPNILEKELNKVLEIIPFGNKGLLRNDIDQFHLKNLISNSYEEYKINNETIKIPERIYFDEPDKHFENELTNIQVNILNCIFLKHHDGYIREKRLRKLPERLEYWMIPFIITLIGEYVYELLPIIDSKINQQNLKHFKKFKFENPKEFKLIESKMISYWDFYHRSKSKKLKNYIGYKSIHKIKTNAQQHI